MQLSELSGREFIEGILNFLPEKVAEVKQEEGGIMNTLKYMCFQVIKKAKKLWVNKRGITFLRGGGLSLFKRTSILVFPCLLSTVTLY